MQQSLNEQGGYIQRITVLAGNMGLCLEKPARIARKPFQEEILNWLDEVSKTLLHLPQAKQYPDVVTFAFFIRRASMLEQQKKYGLPDSGHQFQMGRGLAFHIAPSNVAVNFAYSLVAGMVMGNANIVRLPSKEFAQTDIIVKVLEETKENHPAVWSRFCLIRYDSADKEITDALSHLCDVRLIWGGNETVRRIRMSPLRPRATEVAFADRDSVCVIDSDVYMETEQKDRIAKDFYNDTYLSDQNACTAPRLVVWIGSRIADAKHEFWTRLERMVAQHYQIEAVQSMDKWNRACLLAAKEDGVTVLRGGDNRLFRVELAGLPEDIFQYKGHSGYFMEYDCETIGELASIAGETLQTVSYIGQRARFLPLLESGVSGIDRLVPVGKTMDFSLLWDGYRLTERLARTVLW